MPGLLSQHCHRIQRVRRSWKMQRSHCSWPGLHPPLPCCCLLCCPVWKQCGSQTSDALCWYQMLCVKFHAECEAIASALVSPSWSQLDLAPSDTGTLWQLLRSHPVPLLPKPCYTNPSGKDQAVLLYIIGTGR